MNKRSALITGARGQDGTYLTDYLLTAGYKVHAQTRSANQADRLRKQNLTWYVGDVADSDFLEMLLSKSQPDEIYNLAAISTPQSSWQYPSKTDAINAMVPQKLCELIYRSYPATRLFQASSSEMFASDGAEVQHEGSPIRPRTPYGISKAHAHFTIGAYRSQYGLHLSSGILFNHESPRRPLNFVSQKIAYAAAAIYLGIQNSKAVDELNRPIVANSRFRLGRLDTRRDFGFAGDYIKAMHAIVCNSTGDDYVVGTGCTHSIAELCDVAFRCVDLDWRRYADVDETLIRKNDSNTRADPTKINTLLGHQFPTTFNEMVEMMVKERVNELRS